jgi:hypothetical protein
MESSDNEAVFSRKVLEMITVANEFCLFMEENHKYGLPEIMNYLSRITPLLYLKGSLLPEVVADDESGNERFVTEEQYETLYQSLKEKFSSRDAFKMSRQPDEGEVISLSLADQISDMYQDLKDFVLLYNKNTMSARENAVQSCKRLFEEHWGSAAIRIMFALHHLLYHRDERMTPPTYLNN